jgi:E3 ubiquitin-protein ligase UBR1
MCVDCFTEGDHEGHDVIYGQSFTFSTVCDCGVSSAWRSEGVHSCRHHSCQDAPPPEPLPALIQHSIEDTMAIIIDFIIETLQYSPQPNDFGKLASTADIMAAGLDPHSRTTSEPIERRGLSPWSVILWSDDKHVLRETTRQIRDGTGFEWKKSTKIAREAEVVVSRKASRADNRVEG